VAGFEHDESATGQGPDGMTMIGIGAARGSHESHGPF
jgi:hypothetical protein